MKTLCMWCQRAPRQPHTDNCPALTGIQPRSDLQQNDRSKRRTGAYLRRGRNETAYLPHALYLAETKTEPDTPKAVYEEDD